MILSGSWIKPSPSGQHRQAAARQGCKPSSAANLVRRSLNRSNAATTQAIISIMNQADSNQEAPASSPDADPASHAMALCRVLGVSQPQLLSMARSCPYIFALSPEALSATLSALTTLTGLQPHQLPSLAAADPALLLQPDRLKHNMR
ncbi:hypothetical protein Agub_g5288, partial [Astrephomene gubernaculifera]